MAVLCFVSPIMWSNLPLVRSRNCPAIAVSASTEGAATSWSELAVGVGGDAGISAGTLDSAAGRSGVDAGAAAAGGVAALGSLRDSSGLSFAAGAAGIAGF